MLSPAALRTLSEFAYIFVILATAFVLALSCLLLLSQAVRTSPNRSWRENYDALVIGASYILVLVISLSFCLKRRITVRLKMQRFSRERSMLKKEDLPAAVYDYIQQEYARTCLIAYVSQPTTAFREGWGRPGTKYEGVRFRSALLDTVPFIDGLARKVVPTLPALRRQSRMIHHFRYIAPLLPQDELDADTEADHEAEQDRKHEHGEASEKEDEVDELERGSRTGDRPMTGVSVLYYYDSAIQLARNRSREPTEREFEIGMDAAERIAQSLEECRLEMEASSSTQLDTYALMES